MFQTSTWFAAAIKQCRHTCLNRRNLSKLYNCVYLSWLRVKNVFWGGLGCRYNQWSVSVMMSLVFCHGHNRQARWLLILLISLSLQNMLWPKPHIKPFCSLGPPCRGVWRQRVDVCHRECEYWCLTWYLKVFCLAGVQPNSLNMCRCCHLVAKLYSCMSF